MRFPFTGPGRAKPLDLGGLDLAGLKAERARVLKKHDGGKPPLTRVIPVRRAIRLGGRVLAVDELRLLDLAELQAWLEEQVPHPLADVPPIWADPEPATRRQRLESAWIAAKDWPVKFGSIEGSRLLASREGQAFFAYLCLRRANPDIGLGVVVELMGGIQPIEWVSLRRVAYGITPCEEIADELAPDDKPGRLADWCLSLHRAMTGDAPVSWIELREWPISVWRNYCGDGRSGEASSEFVARARSIDMSLSERGSHGV